MARVSFTADFDWRPHARALIAYKVGQELTVTRACADAAIAAGKAVELDPPSRASLADPASAAQEEAGETPAVSEDG